MTEIAIRDNVDFTQSTFIGLMNGWAFRLRTRAAVIFFKTLVFEPLHLLPAQIHLFNALADDLAKECTVMDKTIFEKGGIDLIVVGVGMNGHIGFNEPGTSFDHYAHVTELDNTTLTVGQKYFTLPVTLKKGITLGLKHLLESKEAFVLASGLKKAAIIKKTIEEKISSQIPATVIRSHPRGVVMIDEEAASLLKKQTS
jgi:6-phosphogluconolactonase/glucosamine-6-phosphate isomerase/deaminase